MQAKRLIVAPLCALVLAAAGHAGLPRGRVGATPEQCDETLAKPEAPTLGEKRKGREWSATCSFDHGRAGQVNSG